jgi:nucleoside 2-deoxyribosyltransferase
MYLAGSFAKGPKYYELAELIRILGYEVQAHWLARSLDPQRWESPSDAAVEDMADIDACDTVVSFLETPDAGYMSGGRHVEFGYGRATGKTMIIIGKPENVFHELPGVIQFENFDSFYTFLMTLKEVQDHVESFREELEQMPGFVDIKVGVAS